MLAYWGKKKKFSLKWKLTTLSIQINIDIKTLTIFRKVPTLLTKGI